MILAVLLIMAALGREPALDTGTVLVREANGGVRLQNDRVKLLVENVRGIFVEKYFAFSGSWHLVLTSGNSLRPDPQLVVEGNTVDAAFTSVSVANDSTVDLHAAGGNNAITKSISLGPGDSFFRVVVHDQTSGVVYLSRLLTTYSFLPDGEKRKNVDFVWTPVLRPNDSDVIADHTFRSPALMVQHGSFFAALIPHVERIQSWRNVETSADVQVGHSEAPLLSYGAMKWKARAHVLYMHSDEMTMFLEDSRFSYGMDLYLDAAAAPHRGYEQVVHYLWERYGHPAMQQSRGPQSELFVTYEHKAWREYLPTIAMQSSYGGEDVTLLRQDRLAWSNKLPPEANNDCWFNVWFNALRTAYGVYTYAEKEHDTSLMRLAEGVLTLALQAPQKEGIAPSIFYVDSLGGHWVNDQGWGGIEGGKDYAMFHNAWTGVWLLAWADLLPGRATEIEDYAGRFGDFLVRQQLPSGVIPSWYDPVTLKPAAQLRDDNAETAGAALFLAELYKRRNNERTLAAAEKAMHYIFTSVLPHNRWFDYETFFSCSRKPLNFFDRYTQQFPQNTLSMHQAAEACLSLYRITGKEEYKTNGVAILDYLTLYQQVWSPPWLSKELFGGFGVQNTDGEWSDSRQGYFAVTLIRYAELTGQQEYFERGVAALRAMFSLFESEQSPRTVENFAHSALDRPGGVTGIHWGTGSSVVSLELIRQHYGDAYINVSRGWGCGIDGCRIEGVQEDGDTVAFTIKDNLQHPRTVSVTFGEVQKSRHVIVANDRIIGSFSSDELRKGIPVEL